MKNLSLFITLGLVTLMGTFAPVNAQMDTGTTKDPQTDGIIDTGNTKDPQTDGIIELHDESSIEGGYTTDDTVEVLTDEEAVVGNDGTEYPAASDDSTIDDAIKPQN